MPTADNVFKLPDTIACCVAAGGFTDAQVNRHACLRPGVGKGIRAGAAVQGVRAGAAFYPVSAGSPFDDVASVITGQRICVVTAENILEIPDTIPCRMGAVSFTRAQVHRHTHLPQPPGARSCVRNGIYASATVQGVPAIAALDDVVAVITGQCIRFLAADNMLKSADAIPGRITAGDFTGQQVHRDAPINCARVGKGIGAGATVQGVRAASTFDDVVAIITDQCVRVGTACHVLETAYTIPCSVTTGDLIGTQVYRNTRVGPCIGDGIHTAAAIQSVRSGATRQ